MAIGALAGLTGGRPDQYQQQAQGLIGQGMDQGLFSAQGSPYLMAQLQRGALRSAEAQRQRGSVLAHLSGLNPYQQQQQLLGQGRQASGQVSDFLNNARLGQANQYQDFIRQLFGGRLQNADQLQMLRLQQQFAKQQQGGGIGALLGGLTGAALPGFMHLIPGWQNPNSNGGSN